MLVVNLNLYESEIMDFVDRHASNAMYKAFYNKWNKNARIGYVKDGVYFGGEDLTDSQLKYILRLLNRFFGEGSVHYWYNGWDGFNSYYKNWKEGAK